MPLPNTMQNTTDSAHYPVANCRPPPPYNESSNTTGPHEEPTVVPCAYLAPNPQLMPAPYQHQASYDLKHQSPSLNSLQPPALEEPYEKVKTLRTPAPPSYADLFKK